MGLAVWRDLSLLWLILLTLIAVLPWGVILFFAVKGMHRLRQLARQHLPDVQGTAQQVASVAERASNRVATPVMAAYSGAAQLKAMASAIWTKRNNA